MLGNVPIKKRKREKKSKSKSIKARYAHAKIVQKMRGGGGEHNKASKEKRREGTI